MAQFNKINTYNVRSMEEVGAGAQEVHASTIKIKGSAGIIHTTTTMPLGHAQRYGAANAWNFNKNNRMLVNNNVNNAIRCASVVNLFKIA